MKKGTKVDMFFNEEYIYGITIENEASSPTTKDPERKVIRVRWDDGSETIENVADLSYEVTVASTSSPLSWNS